MKITERDRAKITDLIRRSVSTMNGWAFALPLCREAANKVIRYHARKLKYQGKTNSRRATKKVQ